jgi:MOSC domain-containing protein YiiM
VIRIHTLSIGQPHTHTDARGAWRSAIYRAPVNGPVRLELRGLIGDQVADTANHGRPDQAVCCHPLVHYGYWNNAYDLNDPARQLGPGSVGENWTLSDMTEEDVCVGDSFEVGSARVQVAGPRYPCTKQERKVGLPGFLRQTMETLRTGFYLRVLTPGMVQAGDSWALVARPYPAFTIQRINACGHRDFDPAFAAAALELPELSPTWQRIFRAQLDKAAMVGG